MRVALTVEQRKPRGGWVVAIHAEELATEAGCQRHVEPCGRTPPSNISNMPLSKSKAKKDWEICCFCGLVAILLSGLEKALKNTTASDHFPTFIYRNPLCHSAATHGWRVAPGCLQNRAAWRGSTIRIRAFEALGIIKFRNTSETWKQRFFDKMEWEGWPNK